MSMTISKNSTGVNVLKDLLKELLMPQEFHVPASFVKRLIGASSMRIARKTAKLFTCLGSSTQLGQSIVIMIVKAWPGTLVPEGQATPSL